MNPLSVTFAAAGGVILIADDNPEARRMLDVRIKREGHETVLVENGRAALEVLARQPVDVVLLDIDMPELDGYGVLASIKADPRLAHVPVLIISGGGDQDDLVRCIEMGAVDYLPKPFNQAVLRARISACVAQKRLRDQERQQAGGTGDETVGPKVALDKTTDWRAACLTQPSPPEDHSAARGPAASGLAESPGALPERLGRIVIQRLLGAGGMGRVYLGHHELLDLPVAVKVLRPELTATPAARMRLLQEARLAARIAHRHVVRLFEVGELPQSVYLAFEYIAGGTLADLLDRQPSGVLFHATAVRIVSEAASALAEANQLGITHRDIKPANLLLTPAGEVKVADFGLAKQYTAAATAAPQMTVEGTLAGTPLYMAPEQLCLGTKLDIRTDLYALGCVLYETLVGRTPFDPRPRGQGDEAGLPLGGRDTSADAIFYHQTHTPPPPPGRLRPDIPAWLEGICLKLLAKKPDDRFQTPEALLAALAAARPRTRRPNPGERHRSSCTQSRTWPGPVVREPVHVFQRDRLHRLRVEDVPPASGPGSLPTPDPPTLLAPAIFLDRPACGEQDAQADYRPGA